MFVDRTSCRSQAVAVSVSLITVLTALLAAPLAAQQQEQDAAEELDELMTALRGGDEVSGWSTQTELTYVLVDGNAESETLGFRSLSRWQKPRRQFRVELQGIRAESTTTRRAAVGTSADDFQVIERKQTELTAERYLARARYQQRFWKRWLWFVGGGWDKNEFSGVDSRYYGVAGLGNLWVNNETTLFQTTYGASYTVQNDVVENPNREDAWVGARGTSELFHAFNDNVAFQNRLIFDLNLEETSDYRAEATFAIFATMSRRLALRVALDLLYDGDRALTTLVREFPSGVPTGDLVTVELDGLDSIFSVSLVINI